MLCPYCGQENKESYRFCRNCGRPRPAAPPAYPPAGVQPPAMPPPAAGQPPAVPPTVRASMPVEGLPESHAHDLQQPPGYVDQTIQSPPPGQPYPGAPYTPPSVTPPMAAGGYPAQQPYPQGTGTPQIVAAPVIPPAGQKLRRPRLVWIILLGFLLVAVLAVVGVFVILKPAVSIPFLSGGTIHRSGKYLAIAAPGEDGGTNLFFLKSGQAEEDGVLLVENVQPSDVSLLVIDKSKPDIDLDGDQAGDDRAPGFGAFVPGTKAFYFWFTVPFTVGENGGSSINRIDAGQDEGDEILGAETNNVSGVVSGNARVTTLMETLPEGSRCYVAQAGDRADLLGEGDSCQVSVDGALLLVSNIQEAGLTLISVKTSDGEETELISEQTGAREPRQSWDGSRVAYIQEVEGAERVVVLDVKEAETFVESDESSKITTLAFAPRSNSLFYIAESDGGRSSSSVEQSLFLLDQDGSKEVTTAPALEAQFSRDGSYLVYLKPDGKATLYSYKVKDESDEKIASGSDLSYLLLSSPERILIREQINGEVTLSSAGIDGDEVLELYSGDSDVELQDTLWSPGEDTLVLLLYNTTDGLYSLYITQVDKEDGYTLIDGWSEIKLLNHSPNNRRLVLVGREEAGDPLTLFAVDQEQDAEPVALDDEVQEVINAVFSGDNQDIYYSTITGDNLGDVEVRWMDAAGEQSPEIEYQGATIVDTQWSSVQPFVKLDWGATTVSSSEGEVSPTKACAKTVDLVIGSAIQDSIGGGDKNCYRFPVTANKAYSIRVESLSDADIDPMLSILDQEGKLLASDDDSGPGMDPTVNITSTVTATFQAQVMVKASKSGDYPVVSTVRILVREGQSDSSLDNATPLPLDSRVRGVITHANPVFIRAYNYPTYGNVYSFDGQAGQRLKIDVFARSLGSEVVPRVLVFDPNEAALEEDDVVVSGNQDYSFLYTLLTSGRHYVLVQDNTDRFGTEDKFFYEVMFSNRQ